MAWAQWFSFGVHPLELIVRGTAVYWFLFALFRFVLHRAVGAVGLSDMLLLVLIADASQNAMAGGYETISEGFVLVGTIAGWNYLMDWASYRFRWIGRIVDVPPLPLIRNGVLLQRNMRREFVTQDELDARLRAENIEHYAEVKLACMESDGTISFMRTNNGLAAASKKNKRPTP